jgi:hypothetical protein
MVLGYALRALANPVSQWLHTTALQVCIPPLAGALADVWPHTGVLGAEKCSPDDMPADSKSQSA